ncbi:hypothetical protein H2200_009300 [Cladophialophora chaetospira]|uniref:Uncharacterized protein n=1 Tax=Cladophialophora chaetospira TaxID=386627 RepID=A0AA39CFH1_9EURO|nr:hypothetical protein H2200_009300 [Cladophialophora chaetospira]
MPGCQFRLHQENDLRAARKWNDTVSTPSDDDSPGSWGMPTFHDAISMTVRTMVMRRSSTSTQASSPSTEAYSDELDEYDAAESKQPGEVVHAAPPPSPAHLPLDIFPVKVEGRAKTACRYYTEVYGPATFRRPQFHGEAEDFPLLQDWMPFLLSNKVTFAALQATAMIHFDLADRSGKGPSPRSSQAYDLAIRLLRRHLVSASDKYSDLVISTMILLSAFDNLSSSLDRAWMHVKAMSDAVRQRGGLKQLGFNGWLAIACDSYIVHTERQQELVRLTGSASPRKEKLQPPVLPFPPKICAQLASLPRGFEEVCLRTCLMAPVLEVLSEVAAVVRATKPCEAYWMQELLVSPELVNANFANATKCFTLLQNPHLPLQDQLILMALQAYCALIDSTARSRYLNMAYLQIHTVLLPKSLYSRQSQNLYWLTWVGMMMLAASHTDSLTWALGTRILEQQKFRNNWAQRLEICKQFFWNDDFSVMVLQKLQYQRNNPSMAGGKFSYISY